MFSLGRKVNLRGRIRAISQGTSFSHGNIIHSTLSHAGYDDNRLSYINSTGRSALHCGGDTTEMFKIAPTSQQVADTTKNCNARISGGRNDDHRGD